MADLPDLIFIIDTNKEHIAVEEASTLRIPVVAILDSNSDPRGISYAVPGNDDAIRAVSLYCELAAGAVLDGLEREMVSSGVRSEARRVGKECVSTCRSRWSPSH